MLKKLIAGLAIVGGLVTTMPASAVGGPYVYVIPVDSSAVTCTTFASAIGRSYAVTTSGVYLPWGLTGSTGTMPIIADTYYDTGHGGIGDTNWNNFGNTGLTINGTHPAAPPFTATHRYTVNVTGNGYPVCFQFLSGNYNDNYGALLVQIDL